MLLFTNVRLLSSTVDVIPLLGVGLLHVDAVVVVGDARVAPAGGGEPVLVCPGCGVFPRPGPRAGACVCGGHLGPQPGVGLVPDEVVPDKGVLLGGADTDHFTSNTLRKKERHQLKAGPGLLPCRL